MRMRYSIDEFFDFIEYNLSEIEHIIIQGSVVDGVVKNISRPFLTLHHMGGDPQTVDIRISKWITVEFKEELKKDKKEFYF